MRHYLFTAPAAEPLTLQDAIAHLRLDSDAAEAEAALIGSLITAARVDVEAITGRALITQTWELKLDEWPCRIKLPRQAVQSITSITYIDTNGATQTLAADQYQLTGWESSEIIHAYDAEWPDLRDHEDVVTVRWVAGYGGAAAVPQPIKQWMLLSIAAMYEQREAIVAGVVNKTPFVEGLLYPYFVVRA